MTDADVLVRVINAPVPVLAGMVYFNADQLPNGGPSSPSGGPEWLIGAVAGIWLVVWLLDKLGKLPTGGVDRRRGPKFEDEDRKALRDTLTQVVSFTRTGQQDSKKIDDLHNLLTFRSDEDGIERWLKHHQVMNDTRVLISELSKMTKEVHDLRLDEQRKSGMLISTLEALQRTQAKMARSLEDISRRA